MRKIYIVILSVVLFLGVNGIVNSSTVFQCDLDNNHTMTLALNTENKLVYDYRKIGDSKFELQLDKDPRHGVIRGPNWSHEHFRFEQKNHSYVIYKRDDVKFGLAIFEETNLLMDKRCVGTVLLDRQLYDYIANYTADEIDAEDFLVDDINPSTANSIESPKKVIVDNDAEFESRLKDE